MILVEITPDLIHRDGLVVQVGVAVACNLVAPLAQSAQIVASVKVLCGAFPFRESAAGVERSTTAMLFQDSTSGAAGTLWYVIEAERNGTGRMGQRGFFDVRHPSQSSIDLVPHVEPS